VRVLIVKLGSIGDVVHTLPVLAAVRNAIPEAEISWVVEERSAEVLRGNALIDDLIEVDTRRMRGPGVLGEVLNGQFGALRKGKFDVAIDFQGLMKSAVITRISRARSRFGFSRKSLREKAAAVFYTDRIEPPPQVHVIRKNLALAAGALDITVPSEAFEFPIFTDDRHVREVEEIIGAPIPGKNAGGTPAFRAEGGNFAILNPGGGWATKLWHAEKFGELADRLWAELGIVPVITTGPNEHELAARVDAASKAGKLIFARPSLKGFYELAKRARVYIGGDTGPTHLAVAAGTPIVGLFGPTEWWRNGSPNPDDICVERTDIGCRVDCHRRTCSKWICMDSDVDAVFRAVEKRLIDQGGRKISIEPLAIS
jgi:heptosyltransferase I